MSDFLIYAARLQDAGVCSLWVSLGSDKEGTRLMHVSPDGTTPPELAARYPTRTFELCGTDRVLERVKDDMLYSAGGVTPEKTLAAIAEHPLLRDDLCAFLADWALAQMPTDEEVAACELTAEDEEAGRRMADKVKAWIHGMNIERRRENRSRKDAAL
ncbi:MAG: hypothetical protein KGO01_19515 [Burkholderiales bacterium]|nr:hypothetical protein [Burkholderiales bacterium]